MWRRRGYGGAGSGHGVGDTGGHHHCGAALACVYSHTRDAPARAARAARAVRAATATRVASESAAASAETAATTESALAAALPATATLNRSEVHESGNDTKAVGGGGLPRSESGRRCGHPGILGLCEHHVIGVDRNPRVSVVNWLLTDIS